MNESIFNEDVLLIGLGGAGVNTAKRISGYQRVAVDVQDGTVNWGNVEQVIPLDPNEVENGINLSRASKASINAAIEKSAIVVICAGLSGNTGSELAPAVAKLAKQKGKIVVAVMFKPFLFEGGNRRSRADAKAAEMQQAADCTICVSNDKLKYAGRGITFADTLSAADSVVVEVMEIISKHLGQTPNVSQSASTGNSTDTTRKCPVCMSSVDAHAVACTTCGFDQLGYVAINREEAEIWFNATVIPARQAWEKKHQSNATLSDIKEAITLRMSEYRFVETVT